MNSGLKSKSKRLVGSESELKWSDIANLLLLFQLASAINIRLSELVQ